MLFLQIGFVSGFWLFVLVGVVVVGGVFAVWVDSKLRLDKYQLAKSIKMLYINHAKSEINILFNITCLLSEEEWDN